MPYPLRIKDNSPATKGVAVLADVAFDCCRALNVTTAGAATVTWADGGTSAIYLTQGYNPIAVTLVASAGLGAATIVALY